MLAWCMCTAISPKNFVCIESEEGYYLVISKITFLDPFYSHQDRVKCVTIPHCTDCTDCCTRMPLPKISFCESLRNSKSRGLLGKFTRDISWRDLLGIFILQIYLRNILLRFTWDIYFGDLFVILTWKRYPGDLLGSSTQEICLEDLLRRFTQKMNTVSPIPKRPVM